jgi:hypothetical protein
MKNRLPTQAPDQESRSLWDKIWKDEQGKRVIYQWPNVWIIIWAACYIVAILHSSKTVASVLGHVAAASLVIWALLEIFRGVNYFRRSLGFIVLVLVVVSQLKTIW